MAKRVRLSRLRKHPREPKKPLPDGFNKKHGNHASTKLANPTGAILSAAMMLDWLGQSQAAAALRAAVERAFADGHLTQDLGGKLTTAELTAAIVERMNPLPAF